uniref:UXT protein n=1 Tax=Cairina moschata TaxID=8855 RepID=A0A8C3BNH1_CAIMO
TLQGLQNPPLNPQGTPQIPPKPCGAPNSRWWDPKIPRGPPRDPPAPPRPDPQRVFVALGYGFFAELTLPEALRHLDRRSRLLDKLSESLTRDGAKIRAHIRLVLEGLRELQGLQDPPVPPDP